MKNPNLKSAFAESEYDASKILELKKCKEDPLYFMENYVKVVHPINGAVPFNMYDYQKRIIHGVHENRCAVVLSPRQTGKCLFANTTINTITKPTGIKKIILKFLDKEKYNKLFEIA